LSSSSQAPVPVSAEAPPLTEVATEEDPFAQVGSAVAEAPTETRFTEAPVPAVTPSEAPVETLSETSTRPRRKLSFYRN